MLVSSIRVSNSSNWLALIFAANFLLAGCGSGSSSGNQTNNNPTPAITSLSPTSLPAGSAAQALTINGSGFLASSGVSFNGASRAATYVSSSQLTIALTSADLSTSATDPVVVSNPAPGGGASAAVEFTVTPGIQGKVEGGGQPIVGAQVYLYAAGTTGTRQAGYGANASSLLAGPGYVITGSDGSFLGSYQLTACQSADDLVYIISVGGDAGGAGSNSAAVLMSALGSCAKLSQNTDVLVNEVTTVASVYALQQFVSATAGRYAVGTSSTNVTGLTNAFLTVANLANTNTGTALAMTPNGNGTLPQAEINTLANIVAACVKSAEGSSECGSLFLNATPPGGTTPEDTLHAVLDIAQNPGNNVTALYDVAPSQLPFAPAIGAAPSDWTLAVKYTGGGLNMPGPPTVDASGNIWVPNYTTGTYVSQFSPLGVSMQGSNGISSQITSPTGIVIDPSSNLWVVSDSGDQLAKLSSTGILLSTATWSCNSGSLASDVNGDIFGAGYYQIGGFLTSGVCEYSASGVASIVNWGSYGNGAGYGGTAVVDGAGNVWVPSSLCCYVGELNSSMVTVSGEPSTGWSDTNGSGMNSAAIDAQENVWMANGAGAALVTELSSSASVLSGSGYAIAYVSDGIAVDGDDTVWTANLNGGLSHLARGGASMSPAAGYQASGVSEENGLALDASGNIWTADGKENYLVEWVGLAAPVTTPLVQNLVNSPNTIGQRP
ncbi:MAG: hypothetical protein ABSF70_03945 [Terracidiphilus sp.]|jgi:hypothetical protein